MAGNLKDLPLHNESSWLLRYSDEGLADVKLGISREMAFLVVAPQLWNSVPREAHQASPLQTFRRQVKTTLHVGFQSPLIVSQVICYCVVIFFLLLPCCSVVLVNLYVLLVIGFALGLYKCY